MKCLSVSEPDLGSKRWFMLNERCSAKSSDWINSRPARCWALPDRQQTLTPTRSTMSSETPSTDLPQPIVDTPAPAAPTHDMSANDAEQDDSEKPQEATDEPRPLRIYTRAQLLHLHGSPLVQPPPDMPELKTWFGCVSRYSHLVLILISAEGPRMNKTSPRRTQSKRHPPILETGGE